MSVVFHHFLLKVSCTDLEVHPLSDEFDWGLRTIGLQCGHVEVIDEKDQVLAQGWTEYL